MRPYSELERVRHVWPQVPEAANTVLLGLSDHRHLAVACRTPQDASDLNRTSAEVAGRLNELAGAELVERVQAFAVTSDLEALLAIGLGDALARVDELEARVRALERPGPAKRPVKSTGARRPGNPGQSRR